MNIKSLISNLHAACEDASLSLNKIPDEAESNSWQLTLGFEDNTECVLKQTTPLKTREIDNCSVLDCNSAVKFWVDWSDR